MSSYLPQNKTYAVCTNQLGADFRIFLTNSNLRENITVIFTNQDFPFLTEKDKKLDIDFSCKTCWNSGAGSIAFGAGVMTGLVVAAAVATVPVAGWIVGGLIAIGCIAYGLFQLFTKLTCNQMIEYDESKWISPHPTVTFDTYQAVVKTSILQCKEGGMILPFISQTTAANAASDIAFVNSMELGTNILANFLAGGLMGFSLGHSGLLKTGGDFLIGMAGAYIVFQPLQNLERLAIRRVFGPDETDNSYYSEIEAANSVSFMPDLPETPSDLIYDVVNPAIALMKIKELAIESGAKQSQISEIDAAIKAGESTGSMAKGNNPEAKIVFEKARNGEYGKTVQEYFTNSKGTGAGMNRQSNYERSEQEINRNLSEVSKEKMITKTTTALSIITLILPFVSTAFDESGLIIIANAAKEDLVNSISVIAFDR
jgi:hypothetical protein